MRTYSEAEIRELLQDKKLIVVSYEAGAAQILSSLLRRIRPRHASYVLGGPAHGIFTAKLPGIERSGLSENLVRESDMVITGTSVAASVEREAISMAKSLNKYCVSIIDHWVHYRQRFVSVDGAEDARRQADRFPDEIWITDKYAYETALKSGLPEDRLSLTDNFYIADILDKAPDVEKTRKTRSILYICEPVFDDVKFLRGDGNAWGYNEYELIDDAIRSLPAIEGHFDKVIFRLHPKEECEKYEKPFSSYNGNMEFEVTSFRNTSLEDDCMRSDCVVGGESMALVVALAMKKKVFSCLPKKALKPCMLPHREIIHINSLKEIIDHIN